MFYSEVGDINVRAQTVRTRTSPPPILEGLGTRLLQSQITDQFENLHFLHGNFIF